MRDFEATIREILGESVDRLSRFQKEQIGKVADKIQELAREGVKEEMQKLRAEVSDLRERVARLEAERVEAAAEFGVTSEE